MTTNNHPAHGPLSLDRLHQIREILSKAAAQSDGGNLGYAMADAVKVIAGAIAAFGAEPVAYTEKCEITNMQATGLYLRGFPDNSQGRDIALYTVPPSPVAMKDHQIRELVNDLRDIAIEYHGTQQLRERIARTVRAAMLQTGNSPVTPDTWIPVSERMPERDVDVQVYCADKKEQMVGFMERNETEGWFRFASLPNGGGVYCKPTHWMPLPAAPQQEVKSALEHGMQRYSGAMQKLSEGDK
ncbi:DUF551 domain-containing protein [Salmonella enterica]|nr:DUF551 domain-containing protein [Salmonella enterica]EAQ5916815.1 DUF551 domain-containing protein [Salmonella enterica subsp. enterica serovar Inverness]ELL3455213.1 DUF551 domain-containing protein [Salmonella enterica subsp. enterica serovar Allandale]EAQ5751141.1 DUF551 domain-containing protein [Salmonella enterica]EAW4484544.1 DUF551 domain-containing protein [Salmonella enterica]